MEDVIWETKIEVEQRELSQTLSVAEIHKVY